MSDNETPFEAAEANGGAPLDGNLWAPHWTPPAHSVARLQPDLASWFQPNRQYNEDECFFPYPHITFLVDKPNNLVCQICQDSVFQPRENPDDLADNTFAIMPCGHAYGSSCLDSWLRQQGRCPACKLELVHPECGHRIPPKLLTSTSIQFLPRTLPDKGAIPPQCGRCLKEEQLRDAEEAHNAAAHEFRESRRRFAWSGSPWDQEAMFRRKTDFENSLLVECYAKNIAEWTYNW